MCVIRQINVLSIYLSIQSSKVYKNVQMYNLSLSVYLSAELMSGLSTVSPQTPRVEQERTQLPEAHSRSRTEPGSRMGRHTLAFPESYQEKKTFNPLMY